MSRINRLADGFAERNEDDWQKAVKDGLRGRPIDTLAAHSDDGIAVGPIYGGISGHMPIAGRPAGSVWKIVQRIDDGDPISANQSILGELAGGAHGVALVFDSSAASRQRGISAGADVAARLFDQVGFGDIDIHVDGGSQSAGIAAGILALAGKRGTDPRGVAVTIAFDPAATLAAAGALPRPVAELMSELAEAAGSLGENGRAAIADGRLWHNAGATEAEELGAALAAYVAYIREFEARGIDRATAARRIGFAVAADSDQFLVIAKLRALRLLHARVLEATGIPSTPAHIHAETSWRMLSRHDRHVNILRTTAAAFAAGVGGADSVTTLPFDEPLGTADPHARRMARNGQLVLAEEAGLAHVADPAAGSGAVEALTDAVAEKAWAVFRRIEADGGVLAAVRAGSIQATIAAAATVRAAQIAHLARPLTGTSEFPDMTEAPLPPRPKAKSAKAKKVAAPAETVPALVMARLAEPFEALREKAGAIGGPMVFLACIGRKADFAEIAIEAANYFGVAGIAAREHAVTGDGDSAAVFKAAATPLACICAGSKSLEAALPAAQVLKAAGAKRVYFFGDPGSARDALAAAGVDQFIAAGTDALALLTDAMAILENTRRG